MNAQSLSTLAAAAIASGPGWAMYANTRRAHQKHTEQIDRRAEDIKQHVTAATSAPRPDREP